MAFNALFDEALSAPQAANAATYWSAASITSIKGRCVNLGYDDTVSPVQYYRWAIYVGDDRALAQRLAKFGLKPQVIYPPNRPPFRGYKGDALVNAFARYLDDPVARAVMDPQQT